MSRPYRALYGFLRVPGALPRAGMCGPFRAGVALYRWTEDRTRSQRSGARFPYTRMRMELDYEKLDIQVKSCTCAGT